MKARVVNLVLAEISIFIAVSIAENSPIALFIPAKLLYTITVIPIVLLLANRNPFGFSMFVVLLVLTTAKVLANSEIFYSMLDAVYYMGFKGVAEYVESIFSAYESKPDVIPLLSIVVLFSMAQIVWNLEKKLKKWEIEIGYPMIVLGIFGTAIIILYPILLSIRPYGFPLLFTGLIGVSAILIGMGLIVRD